MTVLLKGRTAALIGDPNFFGFFAGPLLIFNGSYNFPASATIWSYLLKNSSLLCKANRFFPASPAMPTAPYNVEQHRLYLRRPRGLARFDHVV